MAPKVRSSSAIRIIYPQSESREAFVEAPDAGEVIAELCVRAETS
jgi:hypothetical protein